MVRNRIIWLSNVDLLEKNPNHSGTWIHSMFHAMKHSSEVDICSNITFTPYSYFYTKEEDGVVHYYVPRKETTSNGYPTKATIEYVVEAILEMKPDIIHIWGMELCWGLIMKDDRISKITKLLEIQGIKSIYSENQYFMGGLSCADIKNMRSFVQRIFPIRRVEASQKEFGDWKNAEIQMLQSIPNINTQSDWVRCVLPSMIDSAKINIFKTGIILRDSFITSIPWHEVHKRKDNFVLFTTTSPIPYKGLHVTLKAFKELKAFYPKAVLYVAGMLSWKPNLIRGGYSKYIFELIKELDIMDSVVFLGYLNEKEILRKMYEADVFVISSFIETYCLALAEALALGVPCVVAYSSALPELVKDGVNGLLYPVGDHYLCASKICYYLDNPDFSNIISKTSSTSYRTVHSSKSAVKMQMETYKQLLNK